MKNKSKIAVVKCRSYDREEVERAVQRIIDYLPEFNEIIKPNSNVLLKPNLLAEATPNSCVDTHPEVVRAVVKVVKKRGAKVTIGDSPGNARANVKDIFERSGIARIAQEEKVNLASFNDNVVEYENKEAYSKHMRKIHISKTALESDVIINIPKFKTHNLVNFTGAVKNMFGVIPGFNKGKYHMLFPPASEFSKALLEIFKIVKPRFTIMDAVIGMEGHGPQGGKPKNIGILIGGDDCVAIDTFCERLIGYDYGDVYTTYYGDEYKIGNGKIENIDVLGDEIAPFKKGEFELVENIDRILKKVPRFIYWLVRPIAKNIRIEPDIKEEDCVGCQICINNCPTKTISLSKSKKARINYRDCIMCFCCHELCPYKAIGIKRSWLARKLDIGG